MYQGFGVAAEEILTPQEVEAVLFAQNFYAARAKQTAHNFGQALGLDQESSSRFVESVATELENLDFSQRRELADKFNRVSAILGGIVTDNEL